MGRVRRRQLDGLIKKQKEVILSATTEFERAEAYGFWSGFLNGLKMTGAITKDEYRNLFKDMVEFKNVT